MWSRTAWKEAADPLGLEEPFHLPSAPGGEKPTRRREERLNAT